MTTPLNHERSFERCLTLAALATLVIASMQVTCNTLFASGKLISNSVLDQGNRTAATSTNNFTAGSNLSHTISATGFSTTSVKPDKVALSLGVQTTNNTAKAALYANSLAMNRVLKALLAAGVKPNETGTSSFNISPNFNYSQGRNEITGFTVTNSIQVESSKIANVSEWIDAATAAGANTINYIDYTVSDKKLAETKSGLIKLAIDDAKNKASIAANALGLKLVGVKSISLNEFLPSQQPQLAQKLSPTEGGSGTPIIPGQQQVSEGVSMIFLTS